MVKSSVLIADGSSSMRRMLTDVLKSLGLEVVAVANNAHEAVEICLESKYDIILIDLAIADTDGYAVIRSILDSNPSAAVVLMVPEHLSHPDVLVEVVRAGVRGYIKRSVSPEEFNERIGKALRR